MVDGCFRVGLSAGIYYVFSCVAVDVRLCTIFDMSRPSGMANHDFVITDDIA